MLNIDNVETISNAYQSMKTVSCITQYLTPVPRVVTGSEARLWQEGYNMYSSPSCPLSCLQHWSSVYCLNVEKLTLKVNEW